MRAFPNNINVMNIFDRVITILGPYKPFFVYFSTVIGLYLFAEVTQPFTLDFKEPPPLPIVTSINNTSPTSNNSTIITTHDQNGDFLWVPIAVLLFLLLAMTLRRFIIIRSFYNQRNNDYTRAALSVRTRLQLGMLGVSGRNLSAADR